MAVQSKRHRSRRRDFVKAADLFTTGVTWLVLGPLLLAIGFALLRYSYRKAFEEHEPLPEPDYSVFSESDCPLLVERQESCFTSALEERSCTQRTRVVANQDISNGEMVDVAPLVYLDNDEIPKNGPLNAVVQLTNITHSAIILGLSLLFSHGDDSKANIMKKNLEKQVTAPAGPYSVSHQGYKAHKLITEGSELVIKAYGKPQSMANLDAPLDIVHRNQSSELAVFFNENKDPDVCGQSYTRIPGCAAPAALSIRRDELVARRNFIAGQVIESSIVLPVGSEWFRFCRPTQSDCSKLIWSSPDAHQAIAVIGLAAFVRPTRALSPPNVDFSFLEFSKNSNDCPAPGELFIQLKASRNITVGEVIVANLTTKPDWLIDLHSEQPASKRRLRTVALINQKQTKLHSCFDVQELGPPEVHWVHPLFGDCLLCSHHGAGVSPRLDICEYFV